MRMAASASRWPGTAVILLIKPYIEPRPASSKILPEQLYRLNFSIGDGRVIEVRRSIRCLQPRNVRWSESPIAGRRPRHHVQVEMWNLLAAPDTVVLIEQNAVGSVLRDERLGDSLRRGHHGSLFGLG